MTRDNEIPAIFNPRRVRAPSVVVTGDSPNGSFVGGGFTNILHSSNPQISRSDSICQQENIENLVTTPVNPNSSINIANIGTPVPNQNEQNPRKLTKCKESCCSEFAQKMYFGICVTILVTISWVGATHCIKFLYLRRDIPQYDTVETSVISSDDNNFFFEDFENDTNDLFQPIHLPATVSRTVLSKTLPSVSYMENSQSFNAPFFTAWFTANFSLLFFPIYLLGRLAVTNCSESPGEILANIIRGFRDRGFTVARFFNRCVIFCFLWLITAYLYILSLRALLATEVMSLFATNVASAYLLSWVILHEQFVGVRIVAVILCDTGIALLAYMDGITGSPTLAGVVTGALSGAGYAVFKVLFRKIMGDPPVPMVAFTFTMLGFINASLCWPITVGLYLTGAEVMPWESLSWIVLLIACILMLVFHILTQFSTAVTYSIFVILGLITSVPVSAALDIFLYGANFAGMKLAGVILISIGFFLVMLPNNWPDYITRLLRKTVRAFLRYQCCCEFDEIDYSHSKYHVAGSQREMGERPSKRLSFGNASHSHRLSDGLHTYTSSFTIRPCEMTESISQAFNDQQSYFQMSDTHFTNKNYQRSLTTTVIMADDEIVTTPTKRLRGNSVLEESLLNAGNYIKRKFSYGSSD